MQFDRWISQNASLNPEKVAIRYQDENISYRQLEDLIERLTWVLRRRFQVTAGDRIAYLALNNPLFLALLFACARIGAIVVPLNYRLARRELGFLLNDADPKILMGDQELLSVRIASHHVPESCQVVSLDVAVETIDCEVLPDLLREAGSEPGWSNGSDSRAPLLIVYTSGTTGHPKGAILDQNAIRWNALNSRYMHSMTSEDRVLTVLPFFHVGGINIQTLPILRLGGTVTLLPQFDPAEVMTAIADFQHTLTVLVPTQMQAITTHPQWPLADLSSLRAVTTGSTRVDTDMLQVWHERGLRTLQVYGCTESCPIAIHQGIDDDACPLDSIGRTARFCKVRIVNEGGESVPVMSQGEIHLSGPNIMRGYWNKPEKTAAALRDGWLATGDVGCRDETGHFYVLDRIKNLIISGGENIYPAEIERTLLDHPDIDDAAVFGLPDEEWGEIVATAIVRCTGSRMDETSVREHLKGKVGRFKLPRYVAFVEELPRNTMGKIDYEILRGDFNSNN